MVPSSVDAPASKVTGWPATTGFGVAMKAGDGGVVAMTFSVVVAVRVAPSPSVTRSLMVWLPGVAKKTLGCGPV